MTRTFRNFGKIEIEILKTGAFEDAHYTMLVKDAYGNVDICYTYKGLLELLDSNEHLEQVKKRVG